MRERGGIYARSCTKRFKMRLKLVFTGVLAFAAALFVLVLFVLQDEGNNRSDTAAGTGEIGGLELPTTRAELDALLKAREAVLREQILQEVRSAPSAVRKLGDNIPAGSPSANGGDGDGCPAGEVFGPEANENVQKSSLWIRNEGDDDGRVIFGGLADTSPSAQQNNPYASPVIMLQLLTLHSPSFASHRQTCTASPRAYSARTAYSRATP